LDETPEHSPEAEVLKLSFSTSNRRQAMKFFTHTLFFFLLITQICFGQWVQVGLNDEVIQDIAVQNQNMFAVTIDTCLPAYPTLSNPCNGKLYRSTDNELNWTILVDSNVVDVEISTSGKIFKVERDSVDGDGRLLHNLYYSLDNGNNWIWSDIDWQLDDSLVGREVPEKITVSPGGIIYGNIVAWSAPLDFYKGRMMMAHCVNLIARSTDDGLTWSTPGISVIGGDQFYFRENLVFTLGFHVTEFVVFPVDYVHLSSDYGNTWNYLGSSGIWALPFYGKLSSNILSLFPNDKIFANAGDFLYLSTDTCNTWTIISTLNIQSGLCWSSGSSEGMLIGTEDLGVFLFSDTGDSLGSRNEGLTNLSIHTLSLDNNGYAYAGTENGVWRRPLSEIVTLIDNELTHPTEFILEQNYPNPFNPSTVISYQLAVSSDVVLKVFDVLGNEIATLVDEYKPAGRYEVEFEAALPSGVYFYQLRAGELIQTRKMILIK
jgi:hypothetical protein